MSFAKFEKAAPITFLGCVCAMIISRAPALVDEFGVAGIKFNINAGYVVVFSIPLITLLLAWLWIVRDRSTLDNFPYSNNKWLVSLLVIFPSLAALFLYVQFVIEFAPSGECNTFSSLRYFWDINLWEMKPEYCFNLPKQVQDLMPYIYPPLQTWLYLCLVGVSLVISAKLWKYYRT